jgi:hypothetical protein
MTRLLVSDEVLDDWHPLSGLPAPEYIPPEWDGLHVGKRLAEALRTLRHLPTNGHPKAFGNSWPEYEIEWTDALAQAGADAIQRAQEEASRNRVKVIPTSIEIARMEAAISWPGHYLGELPQLLRVVGAAAQSKAIYCDIPRAAHKLKLPGRLVRRWNEQGLGMIALGLIRDQVRVF